MLRATGAGADPATLEVAASALAEIRKAKSLTQRSLRSEISRLTVEDVADRLTAFRPAQADLRRAGLVTHVVLKESATPSITVELAPGTAPRSL